MTGFAACLGGGVPEDLHHLLHLHHQTRYWFRRRRRRWRGHKVREHVVSLFDELFPIPLRLLRRRVGFTPLQEALEVLEDRLHLQCRGKREGWVSGEGRERKGRGRGTLVGVLARVLDRSANTRAYTRP
eukprot:3886817-Prymnesium_polylepis.1